MYTREGGNFPLAGLHDGFYINQGARAEHDSVLQIEIDNPEMCTRLSEHKKSGLQTVHVVEKS